jgi:thioredoxin 1
MKKIMMFTAPWCAGCKSLKPLLEKLKGKIEIEYIDVEEQPQAIDEYGISNLPTLFFVHDGELVKHRTGSSDAVIWDVISFAEE